MKFDRGILTTEVTVVLGGAKCRRYRGSPKVRTKSRKTSNTFTEMPRHRLISRVKKTDLWYYGRQMCNAIRKRV